MNELAIYGVSILLICFTVLTFILNRIPTDVIPENYEFMLDPFWAIAGTMFLGSSVIYFLFPDIADQVKHYNYFYDILLPFIFALIIYFGYLLDIALLTNLLTFTFCLIISFIQPDFFQAFPEKMPVFYDRILVGVILFVISKGLGLLNGIGGIASMQFIAVMFVSFILSYFGILPQILGVIACAYLGSMLAFAFFSFPPEKMIISPGGFSAIGFVMGAFMLNAAIEFADSTIIIAASYLFTELGIAFYNRYFCNNKTDNLFMNTSYYQTSQDGNYDKEVAFGILKILLIDVVLAFMQVIAINRFAFLIFAVCLNLYYLSVLSGATDPKEIFSLTRLGKNVVVGLFSKKNKKNPK